MVRAHKQAGEWVFHDKSQWEVRWYALPASAERVARAEALAGVAHSEGRQVADISLIDECADDQEDLVVVLWTLVELALDGDLAAALDELYQQLLETPLGQNLARHLPSAKAAFARPQPCRSEALRLMVIAQTLSEYVVRDGQPALVPASGALADSLLPGAVESV